MDAELFRIGVGGVIPIQWEDLQKSDDGPGTLTGWASVYNVVDQQDDVVIPGAFRKTLDEWRATKPRRVIPLTADHENTTDGVIGSLAKASETPYGLHTTFTFSSAARAQDARIKAREGHLNGLSIFGPIFNKSFETVAGKSVRLLKEVGLASVGLTPMPANTAALVLAAKGGPDEIDDPLPDVWICDMKAALAITSKPARKAAVDLLVRTQYQLPGIAAAPAGPGPGGDTTPGEQDGGLDAAAQYALSIIGESGPDTSPPGGEPSDSLAGLFASLDAEKTKSELDGLEAELKKVSES